MFAEVVAAERSFQIVFCFLFRLRDGDGLETNHRIFI